MTTWLGWLAASATTFHAGRGRRRRARGGGLCGWVLLPPLRHSTRGGLAAAAGGRGVSGGLSPVVSRVSGPDAGMGRREIAPADVSDGSRRRRVVPSPHPLN